MHEELLRYYERELAYLRRAGAEFADEYPRVAARLQLEANKCDDPHVERILEGSAFLAARVQMKLDQDAPELSEALLGVAYPQFVRPVPSLALVGFELDPEQGALASGYAIPRGTPLYTRPIDGTPCQFRTCFDTHLWPLRVVEAEWVAVHELANPVRAPEAAGALRLRLDTLEGVALNELELDRLRLHLHAEPSLAATLYEVLCNNVERVIVRGLDGTGSIGPCSLHPVGFEEDEALLPGAPGPFMPHQLLHEYFLFPQKYLFLDLVGLRGVRDTSWEDGMEIVLPISRFEREDRVSSLEGGVTPSTFRLGCTPVVNLFEQTSEPVVPTMLRSEYPIVADARRRETVRIYSVDDVRPVRDRDGTAPELQPLYSFRHGTVAGRDRVWWTARRRQARWHHEGDADMVLTFVDEAMRFVEPDTDALTARLTCHEGHLPARLPLGGDDTDFEVPGGGPVRRVRALVKPTEPIDPPLGKPLLWRLVSQLSLNYTSLIQGGVEALQETLRLHAPDDRTGGEKQIRSIRGIAGEPTYARIEGEHGLTFARGNRVEVLFDEDHFAGGSAYLFASVLERFFGLCVSMNTFCVFVARSQQRKETLREWPPRAGTKVLL
jgi:type VI secretion system protein ImpG